LVRVGIVAERLKRSVELIQFGLQHLVGVGGRLAQTPLDRWRLLEYVVCVVDEGGFVDRVQLVQLLLFNVELAGLVVELLQNETGFVVETVVLGFNHVACVAVHQGEVGVGEQSNVGCELCHPVCMHALHLSQRVLIALDQGQHVLTLVLAHEHEGADLADLLLRAQCGEDVVARLVAQDLRQTVLLLLVVLVHLLEPGYGVLVFLRVVVGEVHLRVLLRGQPHGLLGHDLRGVGVGEDRLQLVGYLLTKGRVHVPVQQHVSETHAREHQVALGQHSLTPLPALSQALQVRK